MDIERALVSKIVSTGQLDHAISEGVRLDLLEDDECRDVFEYVTDHARKYKTPPSISALRHDKPEFELVIPQENMDWLIDRFLVLAKRRMAQATLFDLAAITDDPDKGADLDIHFLEAARKLATLVPSTRTSKFKQDMEKRIEQYEQQKEEGKIMGVPTGFRTIDQWTGGIQPHEFVTVSAFSGLGKSTMLMTMAFNAWAAGYTPLVISLEMESGAIMRKFDTMAANLDYNKLKNFDLPEDVMENWRDYAKEIQQKSNEIPVIDSIRNCTPDHIFAETVRHKPDIVFVDYLSLMRSTRPSRNTSMWQSLTEITQDLKQNARTLRIPLVAAAQTNRSSGKDGAELDNIGYSISVVQDSDIVFGLFQDEKMRESKTMEIRVNKNRDGRLGKLNVIWNHDTTTYREPEGLKEFNEFMFKREK